jgi:hypothetical protein
MSLLTASLAERPDLAGIFDDFPGGWPDFMYHDLVSNVLYDHLVKAHPESNLIAVDPAFPDKPVARVCAFPFTWDGDLDTDLPVGGYDRILLGAAADLLGGRPQGRLAAVVEMTIQPVLRGTGLSGIMLGVLRHQLADLGYESLVAPVRPNRKHEHPTESMEAYVQRMRPDGLPEDPWLRTHIRAGATISNIAPTSMTVVASLDDWRTWTGLPFDVAGPVIVPYALVPVECDPAQGIGTYVEPNIWVHHRLV